MSSRSYTLRGSIARCLLSQSGALAWAWQFPDWPFGLIFSSVVQTLKVRELTLAFSKTHLIQSEAARFRPLALRSSTSKNAALQWIRDEIAGFAESVFDLGNI